MPDEMVEKAIPAIYQTVENYPKYALQQMNGLLAKEIAIRVLTAALADHVVVPKAAEHDVRLAVARSIGRTAGETNHMVRADDAIRAMISAAPIPQKER